MRIYQLIVYLILFLSSSCNNNYENPDAYLRDSILDSYNNERVLVINSPGYKEFALQSGLDFSQGIIDQLKLDSIQKKYGDIKRYDSLMISNKGDSLLIKYLYYSNGCNDVLPYYEDKGDSLIVSFYRLIGVDIQLNNHNFDVLELHNNCENIMELDISIHEKITQNKKIYFVGDYHPSVYQVSK